MTLLREAIGESLRRARVAQSRTLREVSTSARVSLGYLSEVERGRKEASSELLAAICQALDVPLSQVLFDVSAAMADADKATALANEKATAKLGTGKVAAKTRLAKGGDGEMVMAADGTFGPRIVIPAPKSDRLVLVAAK
ncbi:helix-turn-helix domain-containing protein [Nocardia seriolae]|uniref:Transcriptional regulator ClgR n=1 Tax=Nocardia seriolae TaxID=37332 RepID=A0A0B8N5G8_9NOCA|nr:helix-turn-helix transcriptional regulator [Nocardia seriolae]APB00161.1 Transcriptional regulator ClgR [Nocardia seriolae]MTJ64835.1 helix-turn-helix domain-containing protein [Nocardia seriolae]MTJ72386.1 helix-turn-helix domain-containing protein [Nocardia seriolae]MTJ89670.1 helix-turn-helix domain-containing protein [Nocardia seriolae]MTK33645.1 helix-turn-helix domain-containing protein [Nocardia seriolae]